MNGSFCHRPRGPAALQRLHTMRERPVNDPNHFFEPKFAYI